MNNERHFTVFTILLCHLIFLSPLLGVSHPLNSPRLLHPVCRPFRPSGAGGD